MYKDIKPLIKNTVMQVRTDEEGKIINYTILPKTGYVLHTKSRDEIVVDEYGNETGEIKKGYTKGLVTVLANYDFENNIREIYAVKINSED